MKLGLRLWLLLALIVSTGGCATFKKINVYTDPQEMAIGEIFSSEVEAAYPVLHDPRVSWYLNHRGRELAVLSERNDLPYTFGAIDTPELNAFAIPGGHIYFNLGMVESAENESELLGVIAHEIGHVVARHSMKQLSQQSIVSIVGNVALNQYPNQWAALAANMFGTTGFLKLSRDAEREADNIGFELMVRAGFHPEGMVSMFERLLKLREKEPNLLDKLFMTHPPTQERIDNIKARIAATNLPEGLRRDSDVFREIHTYVLETYYTDSYRRRWKEYLRQKEKGKEGAEVEDEDRLPWDRDKQKDADDKDKDKDKLDGEDTEGDGDQDKDDAVAGWAAREVPGTLTLMDTPARRGL
jgi:predicted Zn-dependent protease